MFVREMSREECQGVVTAGDLARLACSRDGQPYIVPITYPHPGNKLYSISMPGQKKKIDWMRINPRVWLQIAEFASNRRWKSVVVTGERKQDGSPQEEIDRRGTNFAQTAARRKEITWQVCVRLHSATRGYTQVHNLQTALALTWADRTPLRRY
ncbi:pyridoxamine 5'-phosphate oxidase family protein [Sinorhizobium meliloti]|uniref:pyridoxamine 5'-phosphate oxidase family protein n=1 Tax=Rhizobium meliloti TaxID=382 RepID=UPI000FD6D88D|nr:pyridoxamine 5'-phosphate oxidase family protein [Sinorhizobium meliloti]RVJ83546.1 pyridoxamine 5'-phosphate oxidase family protein [Sinorhizobium meliloti]